MIYLTIELRSLYKHYRDMETPKIRKGIVLIAVNTDNKYLLLKHKKNDLWGFISGGIEEGETHIQAAVRETKEESGLDLNPNDIQETKEMIEFVGSKGPAQQKAFVVKLENPSVVVDGEEISEFGWFTKEELLENLAPKQPLVELFTKVVG